jgi:6-phosphogluconolactonase/glucosamine-6-phosphate isomerase/deaminase
VIWAARSRLVLPTGIGKAQQISHVLEGEVLPSLYPVQTVRGATWLLDHDAASLLSK